MLWMGVVLQESNIKSIQELERMELNELHTRFYKEYFETYLLERTSAFMARCCERWFDMPTSDYLANVEQLLAMEQQRSLKYLHKSSWPKIEEIMKLELLQKHQKVRDAIHKAHCRCTTTWLNVPNALSLTRNCSLGRALV